MGNGDIIYMVGGRFFSSGSSSTLRHPDNIATKDINIHAITAIFFIKLTPPESERMDSNHLLPNAVESSTPESYIDCICLKNYRLHSLTPKLLSDFTYYALL